MDCNQLQFCCGIQVIGDFETSIPIKHRLQCLKQELKMLKARKNPSRRLICGVNAEIKVLTLMLQKYIKGLEEQLVDILTEYNSTTAMYIATTISTQAEAAAVLRKYGFKPKVIGRGRTANVITYWTKFTRRSAQ